MSQTSTIEPGPIASEIRGLGFSGFGASPVRDTGQRPAIEYGCVDWYPYADDEQTELFHDKVVARA